MNQTPKQKLIAVGVLATFFLFAAANQGVTTANSAPEPFPGFSALEGLLIILGIFVLLGIRQLPSHSH